MSSPAARGLSICGNTFPDECCRPNRGILSIEVLAAQPPDEWCRPNRGRCVLYPVGTRGGVGWMRGPCACPGGDATGWPHATQTTRQATRTSTRPPPCSTSTPCPYRTQADIPNHSPIRSSKFIRSEGSRVDVGQERYGVSLQGLDGRLRCSSLSAETCKMRIVLQSQFSIYLYYYSFR